MKRKEALEQYKNVFDIISDCLEQAKELCKDHGYPVDIQTSAPENQLEIKGKTWAAPIKLTVYSE